MYWEIIQTAGFVVFLLLTVYYTHKKDYLKLLSLYFGGMAFGSCFVYFITIWSPVKIIMLGIVYCLLFNQCQYKIEQPSYLKYIINSFVILLLISNIIGLVIEPKYTSIKLNPIVRILLQDFAYFLGISILVFYKFLPPNNIHKIYNAYSSAIEIAIVIALVHYLFNFLGLDFMPISRQEGISNDANTVVAQFGGKEVLRIYGFVGEPKNLGFLLVPYIVMSFYMLMQNVIRKSKFYHIIFIILSIFVLINTYSSSALIEMFIIILIISICMIPKINSRTIVIVSIICVFFILSKIIVSNDKYENDFFSALYDRTIGRGTEEMENERQETFVFNGFMNDNLVVTFLGCGLSQYTFRYPNQILADGGLIPIQSGIALTLADFGLLGLLLYIFIFIVIFKNLVHSLINRNVYVAAFSFAAVSSYIGSLMYGNITNCFLFLSVSLYAQYGTNYNYLKKI